MQGDHIFEGAVPALDLALGVQQTDLTDKNIESNHGPKGVNRTNEWKIISTEQNPIPQARFSVVPPNESTVPFKNLIPSISRLKIG
jgi:hypothetical protein